MNFEEAAQQAKNFTNRPEDDELLKLYALFKQGTVGDCNTGKISLILMKLLILVFKDRPGFMDFKGKAKWDSWKELKGMPTLSWYQLPRSLI